MRKFLAFTLAEVLVTMTIVGVVASMTIPTLRFSKTKKEYSVKLRNFYSRMENSILDMEMERGSFRDMRLPTSTKAFDWYMDNIDPYMGHEFIKDEQIYFKDGSKIAALSPGGCLDVHYDTNGDKGPNAYGYDRYLFLYCFTDHARTVWFGNPDIFFGTYSGGLSNQGASRDAMIQKCNQERIWCSRLLQNDQWEYKSDYPIKF